MERLGDGSGDFSDGGSYPVAIFPQGGVLADLSGDGKPEAISGGAGRANYSGFGPTQVSVLRTSADAVSAHQIPVRSSSSRRLAAVVSS